MKTKLFILIAVLLSITSVSKAADGLNIADMSLKPGDKADVKVSITPGTKQYTGFQFDITLPDGISLENNTEGKPYTLSGGQPEDLVCDVENLGSNSYRFVVYSNSLKLFSNGEVLALHVKAGSDMELGNYTIKLDNIALSDTDGNVTKIGGCSATMKVTNYFSLTYMVDGVVYKTVSYEYGADITPEAAPEKVGHTFSGWSWIPSKMPAEDVTVTGTFTVNKYKLTYMVDGNVYKTYDVEYGAKITPEAAPTKEGYTFSGWKGLPATMPAKDVTVTGTFAINKYKLTYKVDGEVYKTYEIEYGAKITPEAEPTKEGYTFSGWKGLPATMPAKNVTVTGSFTINKYKLTYKVDGEVYKTYEIEYGAKITPEAEPTKEGYSFSGWSSIPETMPAHDVTITGTFTQVDYEVDDVTYEMNDDGTLIIKGSYQKGDVTIESSVVINGKTYQVTIIAEGAFQGCDEITSLTIPDGIKSILANAFNGCSGLKTLKLGKDIQFIGSKAFANIFKSAGARTRGDDKPFTVECLADEVPETAADCFDGTPIENAMLLVDDAVVNAYKTTSPWSGFGKIIGFEEAAGINSITAESAGARIFDMQGNRLDKPQKGVNIIRMKDGKTKKVMVK